MKSLSKLIIGCVAVALALTGAIFLRVSAQDSSITSQQIDLIRSNCVSTKNTLNQLHASDALLRVNRGQIYESIETKLMAGFNGRLLNNNFNNSNMTSITNNYESTLNTFRSHYIVYEEQLTAAINIDCLKQPTAFYDAISSARTKRDQVHSDVVKLNQYVDQYQAALDQFEKDYQTAANGMKQ
jgi:hypothetical protein